MKRTQIDITNPKIKGERVWAELCNAHSPNTILVFEHCEIEDLLISECTLDRVVFIDCKIKSLKIVGCKVNLIYLRHCQEFFQAPAAVQVQDCLLIEELCFKDTNLTVVKVTSSTIEDWLTLDRSHFDHLALTNCEVSSGACVLLNGSNIIQGDVKDAFDSFARFYTDGTCSSIFPPFEKQEGIELFAIDDELNIVRVKVNSINRVNKNQGNLRVSGRVTIMSIFNPSRGEYTKRTKINGHTFGVSDHIHLDKEVFVTSMEALAKVEWTKYSTD